MVIRTREDGSHLGYMQTVLLTSSAHVDSVGVLVVSKRIAARCTPSLTPGKLENCGAHFAAALAAAT